MRATPLYLNEKTLLYMLTLSQKGKKNLSPGDNDSRN